MRTRLLTFGLIILCVITTYSQERLSLSLEDCINYALENNEAIKIAKLERRISDTQIDETLARGLPQLNGSIGITRNFNVQVTPIPDFISPSVYQILVDESLVGEDDREFGVFPAAFGTDWNGSAGITARQLIFDGSFFVGLEAAKTVKLLTQYEQAQTETDIVENVSKTYYSVLIAQENLEFIARNYEATDTLLRETQAMYESGFAERIDVSRIKIQHNNLKTELKNNTDLLVTSSNLLKFQMGMPVSQPIEFTSDLSDVENDLNGEALFSQYDSASFRNRPEYDVLQTNKLLLDLNIKNFRSQYLPNIYANFNYGWTSGTQTFNELTNLNDETWFKYSNLGVVLSIPIFDGFSKRANIQRNRIQRDQIDVSIDQFENNVAREVTEANIGLENAKRNLESQRENVELADQVYHDTKIKYQEGLGPNLDVVQANTSLKQAQTNYLNALFEVITSQIELKKALGTLYNKTN